MGICVNRLFIIRFNVENQNGITNVLTKRDELSKLYSEDGKIDHLSVLTTGPIPPNPAELLGLQGMKDY